MTNERGAAVLVVMVILMMMTALGIAAITVTNMESTSAGYARTNEAGVQAAEACVETGVNVVQQVMLARVVPGTLVWPNGPIAAAAAPTLAAEIVQLDTNNADFAIGAGSTPDLFINVPAINPAYQVTGDIDKDYRKAQGAFNDPSTVVETFFRINCFAQNLTTGSVTNVQGEYYCYASAGDQTCKRKPT
ncbi:MAG: hypothetical protein U0172_12575 [Nitrospiraceae bacterium]